MGGGIRCNVQVKKDAEETAKAHRQVARVLCGSPGVGLRCKPGRGMTKMNGVIIGDSNHKAPRRPQGLFRRRRKTNSTVS